LFDLSLSQTSGNFTRKSVKHQNETERERERARKKETREKEEKGEMRRLREDDDINCRTKNIE
jgi:hypothetical protein